MKTPEEIKRGLECHGKKRLVPCEECAYDGHVYELCVWSVAADALAYIQQLERERDALREGLKTELGCNACKHFDNDAEYVSNECISCGKKKCHWEWRGVEEDDQ